MFKPLLIICALSMPPQVLAKPTVAEQTMPELAHLVVERLVQRREQIIVVVETVPNLSKWQRRKWRREIASVETQIKRLGGSFTPWTFTK
jgi:hypothetical protein